jgi:hypothetical protein
LRILELAGPAYNLNGTAGNGVNTRDKPTVLYVILSLPHSGGAGHCCVDKIPYDSRLLEDDLRR